jgi:hypothetical protein
MYELDVFASAHVVGSPVCPPSPVLPSPRKPPEELPLLPPLDDDEPSLPPSTAKPPPPLLLPPHAPTMTEQPRPKDKSEKYTRMGKV